MQMGKSDENILCNGGELLLTRYIVYYLYPLQILKSFKVANIGGGARFPSPVP